MNISLAAMAGATALAALLVTSTASAVWSSYEYRNAEGEARYGIRNGTEYIPLNRKTRKEAGKVAGKMNKADKKDVMADPNGDGDVKFGGELLK